MRILFTGASSFTGLWFVRALVRAGHEVVATYQGPRESYGGPRGERVRLAAGDCEPVFECSFGSPRFLELIAAGSRWDVLCHHAADVTNYKSPDFDVLGALANNTRGLSPVLDALSERGCRSVCLTGSVFEQDEGRGGGVEDDRPAFSPYGLSKGLTAQLVRYRVAQAGLRLSKFVIPNPFGPYEEPRFTAYLVRSWYAGTKPAVNTPAYVRDNIHVSLLACSYADYVVRSHDGTAPARLGPSQYAETQGAFATRFAAQLRGRLGLPCELELRTQTEFTEPLARTNTDAVDAVALGWDEASAWDEAADYYRATHGPGSGGA